MSKPITGTLVWKAGSWQVRIRTGETDVYIDLETTDEAVAKRAKPKAVAKYLAGLATKAKKGTAKLKVPASTVAELAVDYYEKRKDEGVKNARGEKRWFELHVTQHLGSFLPKSVTVDDVERLLLSCKKKGLSKESVTKVRAETVRLWNHFIKCGLAQVNVGELSDMPRMDADERPRQILSNEEFIQYLQHPDELGWTPTKEAARKTAGKSPLIDREVKTLATIARCVGGARTSDLHALTWSDVDTSGWSTVRITRPKTKRKDTYYLPEIVVPVLKRWWADHDSPTCGPVFPTRSNGGRKRADGSAKSGAKQKCSYAKAFRRDLLVAGVDRPELHADTDATRQIDFHSLRRGFVSAVLDDTDTDVQDSMKLAGHGKGSFATHQRYHIERAAPLVVPPAALPQLPAANREPERMVENRPSIASTIPDPAEIISVSSHGDDHLGTIAELLKQLSPENLVEFSGLCSGADGTRTRGLRRDRPQDNDITGEIVVLTEACRGEAGGVAGTIFGETLPRRDDVLDRIKSALGTALMRADFGAVQRFGLYAQIASTVLS